MESKNDTRKENIQKLLLRLELWFAPMLIIVPIGVSFFFIWDWMVRGFSTGSSAYDGELILGLLLLFGNLFFYTRILHELSNFDRRGRLQ